MSDDLPEPSATESESLAVAPAEEPVLRRLKKERLYSAAKLAMRNALEANRLDDDRRFTLTGMFALVTFAAVVFALGRLLPLGLFVGVTGLATVIGMAALMLFKGPPMVAQIAWWLLLAIYYLAALGWVAWG
ncbi:MAG TPA: hypothetical protein VMV10_22340 [Pirellulales bacterium]|nr:hypothetical protein [Pirellulales bacterium]